MSPRPFLTARGRYLAMLNYEVPPEVPEDREASFSWAREAIRAGPDSQEPAR